MPKFRYKFVFEGEVDADDRSLATAQAQAIVRNNMLGPSHFDIGQLAEPDPEEVSREMVIEAMSDKIDETINGKSYVIYSAYEYDNEMPINNLDDVAFVGKIQFESEHGNVDGSEGSWKSEVMENPTWLQLAVLANESIKGTGDHHHIYFEGITVTANGGVSPGRFSTGRFSMGS